MDKRIVLFLVLSAAILVGYPFFLKLAGLEMPPVATAPAPEGPTALTSEGPAPAAPESQAPAAPPAPRQAAPAAPAVPAAPAATRAVEIPVETDLYRATLSTRGGVITRWALKRYFDDDRVTPVELLGTPEEGTAELPLALSVDGAPGFADGLWSADAKSVRVSGHDTATLRLTHTDPATGATVVKSVTFRGDHYTADVVVDPRGLTGDYTLSLGSNFGIRKWGIANIGFVGPASLVDGDVHRDKTKNLSAEPLTRKGDITWTVTEDKYFIAALIPKTPPEAVVTRALAKEHVITGLVASGAAPATYTLYAGPKDYERLKSLDASLQENIDFGWFMFGSWSFVRLLAEPMFVLLTMIDRFVGNYGVSIILLTLLIKTVFIPLTHKSYKSMRAMQAIQPQVKHLQEKYKGNKEKLSKETMALYKEHQINPLGGCLPMFIQIPFFIAFFNILYTSIELRHAPFYGWITDLSAKDPYYILPVIMGVSMFVQQKIQPTSMDPKQARIMMFLPVVFTFFFMNFPAGLVLYWLFNNLFTITQQFVTTRLLEKRRALATAKKAG
jgi:YidC/Oxa1 family membrane protein insertase